MEVHTSENREALNRLATPTRNNYFYGKLLDVRHFRMEQRYFNHKRWLINRLSLGVGVLRGLEVELEGQNVKVSPGVAIDPLGREVIVPEHTYLEEAIEDNKEAYLCLSFTERNAEPAPVMVGDCEMPQQCAPGTICERFNLSLHYLEEGEQQHEPFNQCDVIFPESPEEGFDRHQVACDVLGPMPSIPSNTCVILAKIVSRGGVYKVEACPHRSILYDNATLIELLFCLADKVDDLDVRLHQLEEVVHGVKPPVVQLIRYEPVASPTNEKCYKFRADVNSDRPIVKYDWEFGDGETSEDIEPRHCYSPISTVPHYEVSLTVTDEAGLTGSLTIQLVPTD